MKIGINVNFFCHRNLIKHHDIKGEFPWFQLSQEGRYLIPCNKVKVYDFGKVDTYNYTSSINNNGYRFVGLDNSSCLVFESALENEFYFSRIVDSNYYIVIRKVNGNIGRRSWLL
jgi:hypothetical protein